MSAPVDVLAVLNRAEPIIANSDHGDAYAVLTMLPEARAAVAELIEAAQRVFCVGCHNSGIQCVRASGNFIIRCEPHPCPKCTPLRAALARVGGGK